MEKAFKDFYKLPLHTNQELPFKAICADGNAMAYDVTDWKLEPHVYQELVEIVNGERAVDDSEFWSGTKIYLNDGCKIYKSDELTTPIIIVRGWGRLTGFGMTGCRLQESEAKQIQDDFTHYIIEQLNNRKTKE